MTQYITDRIIWKILRSNAVLDNILGVLQCPFLTKITILEGRTFNSIEITQEHKLLKLNKIDCQTVLRVGLK